MRKKSKRGREEESGGKSIARSKAGPGAAVPLEKNKGLPSLRGSLSAFMGPGAKPPGKIPVVLVFLFNALTRSGLKAENQNRSFFPEGAAAPGPCMKTNREFVTTP